MEWDITKFDQVLNWTAMALDTPNEGHLPPSANPFPALFSAHWGQAPSARSAELRRLPAAKTLTTLLPSQQVWKNADLAAGADSIKSRRATLLAQIAHKRAVIVLFRPQLPRKNRQF